ncbi:MAG: 50S ribosomal protein L6 [Planctomycetota bacterium]
MSRIGKQPVPLPSGVNVTQTADRTVVVKGPKGELRLVLRPEVDVAVEGSSVQVSVREGGEARANRAFHGMTRALLNNMVAGVTKGFEKRLEIQGVGWNAAAAGKKVTLNIGFNKPVTFEMPKDVVVQTPTPTSIVITGPDKQAVGNMAATIRKRRPPEPYKGKGVRYEGEVVRRKAGKSFGS